MTAPALAQTRVTWSGLIAPIDTPTGDRRRFANPLRHRDLPLPLLMQLQTSEGHLQSVTVGRITRIWLGEGGMYASGDFLNNDHAPQAIEQLRAGVIGPSVDLDDLTYEMRNPDGTPFSDVAFMEALERGEEPVKPEFVVTDGRISATTLVAIPAFNEVKIELGTADLEGDYAEYALVASAAPVRPPLAAFADPELTGPTPFTITEDGRVFGHVATWSTCHVGFPGSCVTPPQSATSYAYFHTGALLADDGTTVPVGRVVVGTKHATLSASLRAAAQHYDETGAVGAYVRAGDDEHGIWVAGVLADDLTEQQLATLRANPLSGDWRRSGGSLEMVCALSVPVPGFPIARTATPEYAAEPEPFALVAAGALVREPVREHEHVDITQLTAAVREALRVEHAASAIMGELEEGRRNLLGERRAELLAAIGTGE